MALDRKPVTIHYRKYVPSHDGRRSSLEHMIQAAMNTRREGGRVRDRVALRVRSNGSDNYLVNTYEDATTEGRQLAFGDVIHFTRGQMQAVLHLTEDDPAVLPVRQMPAPARSEYVHSQMFWMVKDDHVFVIQSISLQTEALEAYLEWLLRDLLPAGEPSIVLAAKFDSAVVGGDLDDIKEIVIGGAISGANSAEPNTAGETRPPVEREITQTSGLVSEGRTGRALAREILETLMNGDSDVADEVLQAVPADAELLVQVHIGYKTKKRRVDRTSLRHLEAGLRHIPDSQLSVVAKGVNKSADGSIRLNHTASVKLIKSAAGDSEIVGSLLDPTDVLRAMVQAYSVLSADGKIG